jgi:hypothetical protein
VATYSLTTSPTTIDDGTSYLVQIVNTGAATVTLSRGGTLRPGQLIQVYPEGTALTAASTSAVAGQVTTSATAAKPLPNASDPATLAASSAFTSTFAPLGAAPLNANGPGSKAVARLQAPSTPQRLRWVSMGDSVAYFKMRWMSPLLNRAWGGGSTATAGIPGAPGAAIEAGQSGTGWAFSGISTLATTGTITAATADFDAWFSGKTERYATGATRTYGIGGGTAAWDTAKVYYAKGPGASDGGTFKIQVDGVDEAGFTSVSTSAVSPDLGIATITRGSVAQRVLGVVNLTGTHRVIGVSFEASTAGGLLHCGIAQGGISLTDAVSTVGARTALATFLADFAPDVVTLEMKESAATYGADLAVLLPILRTACPTAAIIGLGSTPLAVNDADQVAQNAALKAACAAKGCTYWDGYSPVVSYANLNALGWAGDGTHVDDKANAFLGGLLLRDLAILNHPGLVSPRDINAATVLVTGNLGIGTTSPTQILDVVAGSAANAAMAVRNTGTSGQTATLKLSSGFSGTQGDASIVATSAELRLNASTVGGTGSIATIYTAAGERVRVDSTGRIFLGGTSGPSINNGNGSPEGVVSAAVGSTYLRKDGGAGTSFYVKESGTGNTGWIAK